MKRLLPAAPSVWLAIARFLVLAFILYSIVSLGLSLQAKYQSLSSLEPGEVIGSPFYGWTTPQLQQVVAELGFRPEVLAVIALSASLICLACFWGVGGLLIWRKSDTWLGLLAGFILFATGRGFSNLLPSQSEAAPLSALAATLIWPTFFLMLYLFPNGKFVPRFTRYLAVAPYMFFGLGALTPFGKQAEPVFLAILIAYALGGLISQIYRYRKVSTPEERQQTKWVVFALGLVIGLTLLSSIPLQQFPALVIGMPARFVYDFISGVGGLLIPALIPLSIGASILRYRLWDIDVILRRTLVYSALTLTLALVFLGTVTLLQALFSAVSGQQSAVSVVISTLLIAALFSPLRRRIQNDIDRRFFRKKYNAEQAIERFAAAARQQTDLDQLSTELLAVVAETMQPESVSLWLKPQEKKR